MIDLTFSSIIAGCCIGLGCWIYCSIQNTILGALLFSCGLLCIRLFKYNLFTGKIQYMLTKNYKWYEYIIILIGNIIGIFIMYLLSINTDITLHAAEIGIQKSLQPLGLAYTKGIGCGALMTIATKKETPLYITSLCVLAFIVAGFNHCIADAFYFISAKIFSWNWAITIVGNIIGGIIVAYGIKLNKDEI